MLKNIELGANMCVYMPIAAVAGYDNFEIGLYVALGIIYLFGAYVALKIILAICSYEE